MMILLAVFENLDLPRIRAEAEARGLPPPDFSPMGAWVEDYGVIDQLRSL